MYLTNLADVCRAAGLKVVEVDGWKTRGHGSFVKVESVVCHHTAGPRTGNMPSLGVVTHGRAGLAGPLCNIGLGRDGTCYIVAAGYAWHAGVVKSTSYTNSHAIGIEAEATGVSAWPASQMLAYAHLCAALSKAYNVPTSHILGHKEVCSPNGRKIDPNFDMSAFRRSVVAHPIIEPTPKPPVKPTMPVEDDVPYSKWSTADKNALIADLQKALVPSIAEAVLLSDTVAVPNNESEGYIKGSGGKVQVRSALTRIWRQVLADDAGGDDTPAV